MRFPHRFLILIGSAALALAATLAVLAMPRGASVSSPVAASASGIRSSQPALPPPLAVTSTPTATFYQLLPAILVDRPPHVELLQAGVQDDEGTWWSALSPDEPFNYAATGRNNLASPVTASLRLSRTGACGPAVIFSDTLNLPPGDWRYLFPDPGLACTGIYTVDAVLTYGALSPTLITQFVVNEPSTVELSAHHGFDRCRPPTVEEMQAWWDGSPYWIFNLYLGGVSFFCSDTPLDSVWVRQVAEQGWTFLLAWVGPQAPCTGYSHRMSWSPATAYLEGRAEAVAAAAAARQLGFLGDQVIYYDMEGYASASTSCRQTVSAFMQGWVDELHDQGLKAGGYGGACSSYVADWAGNNPPPDDVWLAHWYLGSYNPSATVWNTPCVPDGLWPGQQRIKQYAGDHPESWNGVVMEIDSNVAFGEVTFLPTGPAAGLASGGQVTIERSGTPVDDLGMLAVGRGWVRAGGRLMRIAADREAWEEISPPGVFVLDATFATPDEVWVAGIREADGSLVVARSGDGGASWQAEAIPPSQTSSAPPARAYLTVLDEGAAWLAVRLASGSAFSPGRLYFSGDGGRTWEERALPFGAPVAFQDVDRGWVAGGPSGDLLYASRDGGRTWAPETLEVPPGTAISLGRLRIEPAAGARLPALLSGSKGTEAALYAPNGEGWRLVPGTLSGPAELDDRLLAAGARDLPAGAALPPGTIRLDFLDAAHGWVLVRDGYCQGEKGPVDSGESGFACREHWLLLATADGGKTWREIAFGGLP